MRTFLPWLHRQPSASTAWRKATATSKPSRHFTFSEAAYADHVALCQFLPGPASSQVGFAIGLLCGGLLVWLGFTLPSALVMTLCGYEMATSGDVSRPGWLQRLKLVAAAVVAQAV